LFLTESILHDYGVINLPAADASPPEKIFPYAVKFFVGHDTAATMALHVFLLYNDHLRFVSALRQLMLYENIFIRIEPEVNGGNPVFRDKKYCILRLL